MRIALGFQASREHLAGFLVDADARRSAALRSSHGRSLCLRLRREADSDVRQARAEVRGGAERSARTRMRASEARHRWLTRSPETATSPYTRGPRTEMFCATTRSRSGRQPTHLRRAELEARSPRCSRREGSTHSHLSPRLWSQRGWSASRAARSRRTVRRRMRSTIVRDNARVGVGRPVRFDGVNMSIRAQIACSPLHQSRLAPSTFE